MTVQPSISLCLIVKNEASTIERCFKNTAAIASEILVLDTGSTDGTQDIAKSLGAKVIAYDWDEDFAKARNHLMEKARSEWILWIDGDEYYPTELVNEITSSVNGNSEEAGYMFPRKNYYLGTWLKYGGNYPDYQLKLYRKEAFRAYTKRLHEKVNLEGKIGHFKNPCEHYPFPTIDHFLEKFARYTTIDAKLLHEKGVKVTFANSISWLFVKPFFRFLKRYILKRGFLNGVPGLFAAFFDSAGYIVRYTKLWQLQNEKNAT